MGSSYHRIFLKLKFHFIKNKNELSCFYTLCQACFPPSLSLHWRHHKPPPPPLHPPPGLLRQPPDWKCLFSRSPESFCPPTGPFLTVPGVSERTTKFVLACTVSFPWRTYTCISKQESRVSLQPVCSQDVNCYLSLHTGWHLSNTIPLFSCLGAHSTHVEILIWLQLALFRTET